MTTPMKTMLQTLIVCARISIEGLLFGYEYQAIFGVAENVKTIFWR
jgi:hypothetical protein